MVIEWKIKNEWEGFEKWKGERKKEVDFKSG